MWRLKLKFCESIFLLALLYSSIKIKQTKCSLPACFQVGTNGIIRKLNYIVGKETGFRYVLSSMKLKSRLPLLKAHYKLDVIVSCFHDELSL